MGFYIKNNFYVKFTEDVKIILEKIKKGQTGLTFCRKNLITNFEN